MNPIMAALAAFLLLVMTSVEVKAESDCSEWATMAQILVKRWQIDPTFQRRTLAEVKAELEKTMGHHPEIATALKWTEVAYKRRNRDALEVWKSVYAECRAVRI